MFGDKDNLHHAYLITGSHEEIRPVIFDFIEKKLKHPVQGNPDFWHERYDTLTIDDARALRDTQANKALTAGKKIFVIELHFITQEAQNALLKVFEEPTPHTHFFIIAPSRELFLPTLRSRVQIISHQEKEGRKDSFVSDFIKAPLPERLKMLEEMIEEKDKVKAIAFVDGVIKQAHKNKMDSKVLEELLKVRSYLNDRSPSVKLLLEHTAFLFA